MLGLLAVYFLSVAVAVAVSVVVVLVSGFLVDFASFFSAFLPKIHFQIADKSSQVSAIAGTITQKRMRDPTYFLPTGGPK